MHSTPPAPATTALTKPPPSSQGHFCGICNKQFDRRDLRDRHKRRCIKSSTRAPTSKRKSCLACVRSKVRCDTANPTCSRCREKGKECRYTTVPPSNHPGEGLEAHGMGQDLSRGMGETEAIGGQGTEAINEVPEIATTADVVLLNEDFVSVGDTTSLPPGAFRYSDTAWDMTNTLQSVGGSEEWLRDMGLSPSSFVRRPSEDFMITQSPWPTQSPPQDLMLSPKPTEISTPSFSTMASPFQSNISTTSPSIIPHPASPPIRLPASTLLSFLLSIPTATLNPSITPSFIHRNLYPCTSAAVDSVPCPISVAYCLLKAHEVAVGSSMPFIHSTLNTECSQLIQRFDSRSERLGIIDALASVHAMCMYQVINFFDSDDAAQIVTAEKQNPGFLRMGRWLIRWLKGQEGVVEGMAWEEWRVWETALRTVHMVHVVNVVSMHCASRRGDYEPLDDEAVGDLPLPCPEEVWQASSSVEWMRARRKIGEVKTVTGRSLVESGRVQEELEKYERNDLMKIILACVTV